MTKKEYNKAATAYFKAIVKYNKLLEKPTRMFTKVSDEYFRSKIARQESDRARIKHYES